MLHQRKKGFIMVDVIVGVALAGILLIVFTTTLYHTIHLNIKNMDSLKAHLYAQEVVEITRDLERSDWAQLQMICTATSPCHPTVQGGVWTIASGSETLDSKFVREIIIENVYRDSLSFPNSIVLTPGSTDHHTKRVITRITWLDSSGSNFLEIETLAYNLP